MAKANGKMHRLLSSFRSRNFLNSGWSIVETVVYPLGLIVFTPFFINRLGLEVYGVWMLVNSILAVIGALNIGFGDTTIKYVSKYKAENNLNLIHKIIRVNLTIYAFLALLIFLVGLLVSKVILMYRLFDISHQHRALLIGVVPIASLALGLKLLEQVQLSVFKGVERYDRFAQLSIVSKLCILTANVIVVYYSNSLSVLFSVNIAVFVLMLIVEWISIKRFFPQLRFGPSIDFEIIKEIMGFSFWTWMQSVISIIASQVDKLLITQYIGLKVLAYYSIGVMVYAQLHNLFAAASGWLFPRVSFKLKQDEEVWPLFKKARFIVLGACILLVSVLFFGRDFIFSLWLGDEVYRNTAYFISAFLAYECVMVMTIVPYFFFIGAGKVRTNTLLELFAKSLNVLLFTFMFYEYGVKGIVPGMIVAALIYAAVQNRFIMRVLFNSKLPISIKDLLILTPSMCIVLMLFVSVSWKFVLFILALALLYVIYYRASKRVVETV